jgi:hypothetical protein
MLRWLEWQAVAAAAVIIIIIMLQGPLQTQ